MTDAAYSVAGVARHVVADCALPSCARRRWRPLTDFVATVPEPLYDVVGPTLRLRTMPAPIPPFSVPMKLCLARAHSCGPAAAAFRELVRRAIATSPARRDDARGTGPAVDVRPRYRVQGRAAGVKQPPRQTHARED